MIKNTFLFLSSLLLSFFIPANLAVPKVEAALSSGSYCVFTPAGNIQGNITLSNDCVVYEDVNGPASGNLTLSGSTITLYRTLVWYPGYQINITNGARVFINANATMVQTKICIRDQDNDGIPGRKAITVDPLTGQAYTGTGTEPTQLDTVAASLPDFTCPQYYYLRESGHFTTLAYADQNDTSSAYGGATSDTEFMSMGFAVDGVTNALAAAGDITVPGTRDLVVERSLQVNQGATISGNLQVGYSRQALTTGQAIFSGAVGIGLTNPATSLQVYKSALGEVARFGGSTAPYITIGNGLTNITGGYIQFDDTNDKMYISPHALTAMTITSTGLVGVGSTTPTYTFDVTGTGRVTSTANPGFIVGDGSTGYAKIGSSGWYDDASYFSPMGTRNFYIRSTTPTTYIYSPSIYLGSTSGTTVALRGNAITADLYGITAAGAITGASLATTGNVTAANHLVTAANGNALCFWGDCTNYKIHMGTGAEYVYGPVTDYSIKMNMNSTAGRGWTWGQPGIAPIAAIGNTGNMQIAGNFKMGGTLDSVNGSYITVPKSFYISTNTVPLYTEAQVRARGGISNDTAAQLEIDGGTSRQTRFHVSGNDLWITNAWSSKPDAGDNTVAEISNDTGGTYNALMVVGNKMRGFRTVAVWDRLGIANANPSYVLHVNGSMYAGGSSREYKENIGKLDIDSSKIYDLVAKTYDYKSQYKDLGKHLSSGRQFGFIAEEVNAIIPELTLSDGQRNVANVDYEKIGVLVVEEMKKLRARIENLEQENKALKTRIDTIETKLNQLFAK